MVSAPLLSSLISRSDHELIGLITNPDKATGRGMKFEPNELVKSSALENFNIYKPDSIDELNVLIKKLEPDLIITIAFGRLIPESLLNIPRHGWINVHFSILPKWRGAAPVQWAILSGDRQSGVTIFKLDKGMDTGPIYASESVDIDAHEMTDALLKRLSFLGAELTKEVLISISKEIDPKPQSVSGISLAPKFNKNDGKIDWNHSAAQIYNKYRALCSNPGIWSSLGQTRLKIESMTIAQINQQITPGSLFIIDERMYVGAVQGVIELIKLTPAGRVSMSASEFVRGLHTRENLYFG